MKRRQFLKSMLAVPVAVAGIGAIPDKVAISGTVTGRFHAGFRAMHKRQMFGTLYGMRGMGKSHAADLHAYHAALNGKRIHYITGQKNAVIQFANQDFRELETRVLGRLLSKKEFQASLVDDMRA